MAGVFVLLKYGVLSFCTHVWPYRCECVTAGFVCVCVYLLRYYDLSSVCCVSVAVITAVLRLSWDLAIYTPLYLYNVDLFLVMCASDVDT